MSKGNLKLVMRILLVECDEKIIRFLKRGLGKEGFAIDVKRDGEAGRRLLEVHSEDYDLVLLNKELPSMDGAEFCKKIRDKKITLPIIILAFRNSVEEKVNGLNSGADDFVIYPFLLEELIARIRCVLRRPQPVIPTEIKSGDLTVNVTSRKVLLAGREIRLSLKEFALLEYLIRHPNQVVNREQLLDHVWDSSFDSFSNVVDVHIKNLRKKIKGHGQQFLETVRGIGYRFRGSPF